MYISIYVIYYNAYDAFRIFTVDVFSILILMVQYLLFIVQRWISSFIYELVVVGRLAHKNYLAKLAFLDAKYFR